MSHKWNPSTDNVGVVDYGVRLNGNEVATPTQTSYTLTGLACGSSYSLSIAAYDAAGNHSVSGAVTMATSACAPPPTGYDTTPPTVPTNVKVTSVTQAGISVSWSPSTDNVGASGYGTDSG